MEEILKKALEKADGEYADIRFEDVKTTSVNIMGKEIEFAGTNKSSGGSVRVFHRGSIGFATFTRPEDAEKAVIEASRLAKMVKPEVETTLYPVSPVRDIIKPSLELHPKEVPLEEKVSLAKRYNDILLGGGDKIVSTSTIYQDSIQKRYFLSTEGSYIEEERVYTGISGAAIARDGTNIQRSRKSFGDQRGFTTVLNREVEYEKVVKDALDLLKAEKVEAGVYTVILDPVIAGVFIHEAFGHLSEADHVYRNEKLKQIMKIGTRFGPDELSVVDDGSLIGERGYIPYDDDGVKSQKTYLIKNGILTGRLHSRHTAPLMGEEPTGNSRALNHTFIPIVRMTVTYIEPGDKTFEELLEGINNGLYVVGALGGQTELEMFTFSSIKAYKIKNGKLGEMVRDVVLTGNVFETLMNIEGIGNDLRLFGGLGGCGKGNQYPLPVSDGAPHIRIKNVVIGGR